MSTIELILIFFSGIALIFAIGRFLAWIFRLDKFLENSEDSRRIGTKENE